MAKKYIHESVSKLARGVKQLLLIGSLVLLASCGGDAALQADQAVQAFNKQVIKLDTERHSLLSSLYSTHSTAKRSGGVTPSGKVVTNAELLTQNPAVLKMVGAEKTLPKPQRVQAQTLVSSTFSPVFRIQNGDLPGSYFFTIYESERVAALAANPNWSYEGPAFYTSQAEEGGLSPVWRFRNLINGSYVFTIYESERQSIVNDYSSTFAYEGVSWYARQTEALGFTPLYRFRNVTNGTYLFSAYESEKVAILQNYASTFVYEGVAYYVQVPGGTSATPPAMQVTNQTAVLKSSVITGIDTSLTKVDQIGNFTSAAGRTWAKDQVFMYQGRAYKVVGVIVNADGTTSLSTVQPRLDTIYDDLKFTFKANALAYDANLQPIPAAQLAATNVAQAQLLNTQGFSSKSAYVKPQANGVFCMVPTYTLEGKVAASDLEYGYAWSVDCTLNDLMDMNTSWGGNVRLHGDVTFTGEVVHTVDKLADTNYTTTSQSNEQNLTFQGSLTPSDRLLLKASDKCKNKDGVLECEKITPIGEARTIWPSGIPITYQLSYGWVFTVDIDGQINFKSSSTIVTTKGYNAGLKVDEKVTNGLDSKHSVLLAVNAEADFFVFFGMDVGIGVERMDQDLYLAKVETKFGGYGSGKTSTELPLCAQYEAGLRGRGEFFFAKFLEFYIFKASGDLNIPFGSGAIPANCDAKGKARVGYSIFGKTLGHYVQNLDASTDILDVYSAGKDIFDPSLDNGRLRISLSSSGLKGKPIQYEVTMVASRTTSTASIYRPDASPVVTNFYSDKAFIDPGNSTYGSVIAFQVSAFDPNNRAETETMRWVEIRIEPAMSAAPKYQHYVSTSGNEGYLANYLYGSNGAVLTQNQAKSGYLEVAAGDKFVFSSQINNLDTGKDFVINSIEDRTNLRPKRLALLSKLDRAGSEQFFNFVELTDVVISSVNISPAEPTVGNLATFTVTGDRMPANLAVNIPNCSTPVEVRSAGNIAKNNYSTGIRVFTCTPNASGEVVTATFGPTNFAKTFRIPRQTCPAGQTVVNGVCTTTAVTAVISISPTAATLNTATVFTVTGTNLPLTAILAVADAPCLSPVNNTSTGFSQTCTPMATGIKSITVKTAPGASGGTVIDATRTVSVSPAPVRYSQVANYPITSCVFDKTTGLVWEGKEASGMRGGSNLYVGDSLLSSPGFQYANYVNSIKLCGYSDWRPPFTGELQSIVDTSKQNPAIDSVWFPNTASGAYWGCWEVCGGNWAYYVNFLNGTSASYNVNGASTYIRLVRTNSTSGTFSVPANLSTGTQFTVPAGATNCTFNASGTWMYSGGLSSSADGNASYPNNPGAPRLLGTVPYFALIAGTNNGYIAIGSSNTVTVSAGSTLIFQINEGAGAGDSYADNSGALSVSYSCN
jgi:Protein of unknown function (DUF1566)/Repeat of unknown function (DUF5648)